MSSVATNVDYGLRGVVAVLTFSNPPVNSLGHSLREALLQSVDRAIKDAAVKSIVLVGAGGNFCAGADIREFLSGELDREPSLLTLFTKIESSPKPVIAAIEGNCLGGGLELALSCHYRVALKNARLGLPEVKLGLLPGAGGTQRLPRLVGAETALAMIVGGEPRTAATLADTPLLDRAVDSDVLAAAVELAGSQKVLTTPPPKVRDRTLDEPRLDELLEKAHAQALVQYKNFPAPLRCIQAVAAAIKPFDEGYAFEQDMFRGLMASTESKALRHIFFAERAASRIPDVPESTPTRAIRTAAVIGGGTMGAGIALCFLNARIPVSLLEVDQTALDRGTTRIRDTYEALVKKGRMKEEQVTQTLALLTPTLSYESIAQADIVVEAVFEDFKIKEKVFRTLDGVMKPGAILASNTSTLDVDRIAKVTSRPQDVIGMHFFSPANVMRLLEVIRGAATAPDVLATTMKLGKTLKKIAIISGVCDGFIGNRMLEEYSRQAYFMLEEGASPQDVDAAAEKFGMAMGPFRMWDLVGNDVGWMIRKNRYIERPDIKYSKLPDLLCEADRFGQKKSAGWYDYRAGDRTAHPSPVVEKIIIAHREKLGLRPRKLDEKEIVERLMYALVNEGARILEEKIAARASDIDLVYLNGYGYPVWRGGPMFYADTVGLENVVAAIKRYGQNQHGDPGFWTPAPLLARLAAEHKTFS